MSSERPRFLVALDEVGLALDGDALRPHGAGGSGGPDRNVLAATWEKLRAEVLEPFEAEVALVFTDDAGRARLADAVCTMTTEVAALLEVSGDRLGASQALRAARRLARSEPARREVEASEADLEGYRTLLMARWHHRHSEHAKGDALLKKVQTTSPALRTLVQAELDSLRPLQGAPSLWTFNSIGTMLWGARDRWEDGTYVATLCAVVGFMPVFPIAAYRVSDHGGGSYTFYAKTRLSGFARMARAAVLGAAALGILALVGTVWWNAPGSRLARELDDAAELEGEARIARYDALLQEYATSAPGRLGPAAEGVIRAALAGVTEPMTAERVDEADRVVARLVGLPAGREAALPLVKEALGRWRAQVGVQTLEQAEASARLAEAAARIDPEDGALRVEARAAGLAVADRLREEWPLAAMARYARYLEDPSAAARFGELLRANRSDDVWRALDAEVAAWIPHAGEHRSWAESYSTTARGDGLDAARLDALATAEPDALRAQLALFAGDQELTAALSDHLRFEGQLDEAKALWTDVHVGWLVPSALVSYAALLRDLGELDAAARLLDRTVRERMPPYRAAIVEYDALAESKVNAIVAAYEGGGEFALQSRLRGVTSQEEGSRIYDEYLRERLSADPMLTSLRGRLESYADVVPATLALATLQLQRAEAREGSEREALLQDAERHFLSIRQDAEGAPEFHVGLGRVYHRLGRRAEGDEELTVAAAQAPAMRVRVADVYRELELTGAAKAHAEQAFAEGDAQVKAGAAITLSLLAETREEEERWLRAAPQELDFVRFGLASLRGTQAAERGELAEATRLFREVAQGYERTAETSSTSSNNAAVAWARVFEVTGDDDALGNAVALLERSVRQEPDSAIVTGNVAGLQEQLGTVRVLGRRLRMDVLRPTANEASVLLDRLLEGSEREVVLAELSREPALRRAAELWRQAAVLAPTMGGAYGAELRRAQRTNDRDAEARTWARMLEVDFEDSGRRDRSERVRSGAEDAERLRSAEVALRRATDVLAAAERARHAPTIGAAQLLLAHALLGLAEAADDLGAAERAVAAYEASARQGTLLGPEETAWGRLTVAVMRAGRQNAALGARWKEASRELGVATFVGTLRDEPALLASLRAEPEARAAADALAARPLRADQDPDLDLWALGDALGHAELAARHVGARSNARTRTALQVAAHVSPWRTSVTVQLGWLEPVEGS